MFVNNLVQYEDAYLININEEGDNLFYGFDYDIRSYAINMEFQHFHQFYELCILLAPNAIHLLEGTKYNIKCFDVVAIRPNVLHRTYYPEGDPCKRIIIRFNMPTRGENVPPFLSKVFSLFNEEIPIFRFSPKINQELYKPLNEIFMLGKTRTEANDLCIHLKFTEFLTILYSHMQENEYQNNPSDNAIEGKIYSITSYIHTHYSEDLSLDSIASEFFISNYYLSHVFKDVTGFTLTDYIHMTRIRNVQTMLLTTDKSITDIASACGFQSFSQFNRVFRKVVGTSPSKYRHEQ